MQISAIGQKSFNNVMMKRMLVIVMGLAIQITVIILLLVSLQQPAAGSVTFSAVAGDPTACRIVKFEPFTEAWLKGFQQGSIVHMAQNPSQVLNCATLAGSLSVSPRSVDKGPIGQDNLLHVSPTFPTTDFATVALVSILTLIFNIAGITIFLRAQDRPTARVTYGLFYTTSLLFSVLIAYGYDYLWINLLTFFLTMMIRGLSTTFVCLFPRPIDWQEGRQRARFLPYIPFGLAVLIMLGSPLVTILPQPQGRGLLVIAFIYNLACLIVVTWVLFWGLRNVSKNERQLARMIVVGVVFLLTPLAFALNIIQFDNVAQISLTRLIFVPLLILPIACDYALFRHQLLGTTSLISRRVIRALLWLLLASLFVFPSIILLHSTRGIGPLQGEIRDYIFAGILVVSLLLFPLIWGKVRDIGDHVLYHDFYQYNRSLRELSAALTRLQGLDQICSFVLPRLTTLLNASDTALLVYNRKQEELISTPSTYSLEEASSSWYLYRQPTNAASLAKDRLLGVAQLALTHQQHPTHEPLLLDSILLLGLYDGDTLNGFLCLGPKQNIEPYDRQDMSFLATLVAQLAVLVVNNQYLSQAKADAQKLSALNRRVVSAQEDERKNLALELHDEALQHAMLLVRQLSDASTMTEVAEAMPLARSLVISLRQTCLELRPPLLDELGLEEALQWLAQDMGKRGKLQITVSCKGLRGNRPSAAIELALYRVVQEALANVVKHADAHMVMIRLHQRTNGSSLLICDDGRGFQRRSTQAEHLGLVSMHERMDAIGGRIHVRTSPGRGVAIRATYAQPCPIATTSVEQQEAIR